jgi:hypothetical protein
MSDARDERMVTFTLRPIYCFMLRFEAREYIVGMIFDDVVVDMAPLCTAFWARFNVDVCHSVSP